MVDRIDLAKDRAALTREKIGTSRREAAKAEEEPPPASPPPAKEDVKTATQAAPEEKGSRPTRVGDATAVEVTPVVMEEASFKLADPPVQAGVPVATTASLLLRKSELSREAIVEMPIKTRRTPTKTNLNTVYSELENAVRDEILLWKTGQVDASNIPNARNKTLTAAREYVELADALKEPADAVKAFIARSTAQLVTDVYAKTAAGERQLDAYIRETFGFIPTALDKEKFMGYVLQILKQAVDREIWVWQEEPLVKDWEKTNITNARTEVGRAARDYVSAAKFTGAPVSGNITLLSGQWGYGDALDGLYDLHAAVIVNDWTRDQLEAYLWQFFSFCSDLPLKRPATVPSLELKETGTTYSDTADIYKKVYLKLLPAYEKALAELSKEISLWWTSPLPSTPQLAMAKQETAKAIQDYVNAADLYGVTVSNDARATAKQTDPYIANEAVGKMRSLMTESGWTREQLFPMDKRVFNPFTLVSDPKVQENKKGYDFLQSSLEYEARNEGTHYNSNYLNENYASKNRAIIINCRQRVAKRAKTLKILGDQLGVYIDDSIQMFAACADGTRAATEVDELSKMVMDGSVKWNEVEWLFFKVPRIEYLLWAEIRGSRLPDGSGTADMKTAMGEFYADIGDILSSIGDGLSGAQRRLDEGAMQTQKELMEDETLSGYGMSAAWYVMPEAEFTMKLEIGVSAEEKLEVNSDGRLAVSSKTKVVAALSNATYNSVYKTENRQESTLRVKFVPVPMPAYIKTPDLVGMHIAAAKRVLEETDAKAAFISATGEVWTDADGIVEAQSTPAGDLMLAERSLIITVRNITKEEAADGRLKSKQVK